MKKALISAILFFAASLTSMGQTFGPSDPSPEVDCGDYKWPEVTTPCPEVQIKQKHDHTPKLEYLNEGWDTAVTCNQRQIVLSCTPYIPAQFFNGQYTVDTIPYDPPDTTFWMNGLGTKQDITSDDRFAPSATTFDFPFYFFGFKKSQFRIGDNGIVTFTEDYDDDKASPDNGCPWSFEYGLPWNNKSKTPSYGGDCFNRMHDAIYGVFEDTYTGYEGAYLSGNQGIYYGVVDEAPCRKIIATWNKIPVYSDASIRESYQIVCYEGSNIVEVHVKERNGGSKGSSTNSGRGIIGIQNATGTTQEKGEEGSTTEYVVTGSPAAYYPSGKNNYSGSEKKKAYRFTPQGSTSVTYEWFRLFPNGDTLRLGTDITNPNGYMTNMIKSSDCPTLTKAVITPTETSTYVFHMRFRNANLEFYDLYDTIVVGVDTANNTYLHPDKQDTTVSMMDMCDGSPVQFRYTIPAVQIPTNIVYDVWRVSHGESIPLPSDCLQLGIMNTFDKTKTQPITLDPSKATAGVMANKIDSVYVKVSADYASGCTNHDILLIRIFPNFDTTEVVKLCEGSQYIWSANGQTYTSTTKADAHLKSSPGCDSIVHLDLTVFSQSITVDYIEDCKPVTWINGVTYETSNTATAATDTIRLTNQWGCDSLVRLDLTIYPLEARIQSSRTSFNFDHMNVELSDISTNGSTRIWRFPDGSTSTLSTTWFIMSPNLDSADIWLTVRSQFGCVDSAHIVLPLRKETFWVPNIFNPEADDGNTTFHTVSYKTLSEEMFIYNRYGTLVFHCEGIDCPWDGRDMNGNKCPQGTYVYYIRYSNEFEPLRYYTAKGTITLIR